MTELTEIVCHAGEYDPESGNMTKKYSLRTVYVNRDYIVSMREDVGLTNDSKERVLVSGMNKNLGFTKLTLSAQGAGVTQFTIVGHPGQIIERFSENG